MKHNWSGPPSTISLTINTVKQWPVKVPSADDCGFQSLKTFGIRWYCHTDTATLIQPINDSDQRMRERKTDQTLSRWHPSDRHPLSMLIDSYRSSHRGYQLWFIRVLKSRVVFRGFELPKLKYCWTLFESAFKLLLSVLSPRNLCKIELSECRSPRHPQGNPNFQAILSFTLGSLKWKSFQTNR